MCNLCIIRTYEHKNKSEVLYYQYCDVCKRPQSLLINGKLHKGRIAKMTLKYLLHKRIVKRTNKKEYGTNQPCWIYTKNNIPYYFDDVRVR